MYLIKLYLHRKAWRKQNKNNLTEAINLFDRSRVSVGSMTYGGLYVLNFSKEKTLSIGNLCSIGPNVIFCVSAEHSTKTISTYPLEQKILGIESEALSKGDIIVEDDVWIGCNATILSGVRIEKGCVIGAGSVVTKNVPAYSIVCGNPARIIKYRFSNEIIEIIRGIDFSCIPNKKHEIIKKIHITNIETVEQAKEIRDLLND